MSRLDEYRLDLRGRVCFVMDSVVCPGPQAKCSGHGRCMSMAQLAEVANVNGDEADFTYGATNRNPLTWDYNKVFGCHCDEGWHGYDCSLRTSSGVCSVDWQHNPPLNSLVAPCLHNRRLPAR